MRFWEDILDGDYIDCGRHTVSEQEIGEFAQRYDPQPFHCDPAAARLSVYGGVIASGFHTLSLANRMAFESFLREVASMGSSAVDDVRWLMPVRPGDELSLRLQVVQKQHSRNKPDRGVVRFRYDVTNQRREPVCTMTITEIVKRREQA